MAESKRSPAAQNSFLTGLPYWHCMNSLHPFMGTYPDDSPSQILYGNSFCVLAVCDDTGDSMDGVEGCGVKSDVGVDEDTSLQTTESAQLHWPMAESKRSPSGHDC